MQQKWLPIVNVSHLVWLSVWFSLFFKMREVMFYGTAVLGYKHSFWKREHNRAEPRDAFDPILLEFYSCF